MICIYILKCPLSGRPRYVGKTQTPKTRLASHISKAKSGQTHHHCARWIRQLLDQGLRPEFDIVFHVPPGEEWQTHEKRVIEELRLAGFELTNLTGGGGGFYKADPELLARRGKSISRNRMQPDNNLKFRAVMREVRKDPKVREAHKRGQSLAWCDAVKRQKMLDAMRTEVALQRRADATRRRYQDPVFAAADSARKTLMFQAPERREQLRQASLKHWAGQAQRSAELRAAREIVRQENRARFLVEQAERLKQRWQDDDHRAKMVSARWTPEKRAEQAARLAERREKMLAAMTPEVRAQQAESMKRNWAKRKADQQAA